MIKEVIEMVSSNTYEEIYEILSYMNKSTVMKVPENILKNISEKRNKNFKTKIDKNDLFNEENASKEAIDILCWIEYKFWMDNGRKNEIDRIKISKLTDIEKEKYEKYNPDNIFEKKNTEENKQINDIQLVEIKETSWFKRALEKILEFFGRMK
ncbi:MAG: hypothetical protein V8R42_00105 [Clostridia bacterium]